MRESVLICVCVFLVYFDNVFSSPTTTVTPRDQSTLYNKISQKQEQDQPHAAEIQNLRISSLIKDHFKKTRITLNLKNHDNKQKEMQFSFLLPEKDSFVDKLNLETFWHGDLQDRYNKTKINDRTAVTKQMYRDLVAQQGVSVALLEKDPKDPERYNVLVNLPANTECSVGVNAAEILPMTTHEYNEFNIMTKFQTNLEVKQLHYIVYIRDNRPIQSVTASGPKTKQTENSADTLENAIVRKIGKYTAAITFHPDQNQIRQIIRSSEQKESFFTNEIDFVVHYQTEKSFENPYRITGYHDSDTHNIPGRGPLEPEPRPPLDAYVSGIRPSELEKVKAVKDLVESRSGQVDDHLIERLKNLGLVTSETSWLAIEKEKEKQRIELSPKRLANHNFGLYYQGSPFQGPHGGPYQCTLSRRIHDRWH